MDKKYLSPEIEIKKFDCEDVILTSSKGPREYFDENHVQWTGFY